MIVIIKRCGGFLSKSYISISSTDKDVINAASCFISENKELQFNRNHHWNYGEYQLLNWSLLGFSFIYFDKMLNFVFIYNRLWNDYQILLMNIYLHCLFLCLCVYMCACVCAAFCISIIIAISIIKVFCTIM